MAFASRAAALGRKGATASSSFVAAAQRAPSSRRAVAMAPQAALKLYVKGRADAPAKLGDCPFCHRVLLHLAAKGVPYSAEMVDFKAKPAWLESVSGGKVPVLEEENGTRLPDSDKIVPWLEAKFPTPAMPATAPPEVGAKVFPAFRALLFAPDGDETVADKQAELERELATIDGHLAAAAKPFLGGATLNASDASLAPKLYHISVALPAIKGWRLPERFKAIRAYLEALPSSHAWVATDYGTDAIVAGWRAHLAAAHH